jgi:type I restriction enzyme, S subunit
VSEFTLPEGWIKETLGELVYVERGSSPRPIVNFVTDSPNGVNWVKIGDTKEGQKYVRSTKEKITFEGAQKSRFVGVGDFILSNSMSFGRPYIMAIEGYIHDGWFALRLPKLIDSDYFYYLLFSSTIKNQFDLLAVGGVVKNISGDLVKRAVLPLPPLAEQQQIAQKLDELLSQVDTLKTRLDAIPNILKRFRQSVLAAAVSGRLTEEWRGGVKIDCSWNVVSIEKIAKKEKYSLGIGPFGSNLKVTDYRHIGNPLVFVRDIRAESFGGENTKFVDDSKFLELKAHRVKPGDILITKMGDPPGDVSIYPKSRPEAVITSDCIKLSVDEDVADTKFLYFLMKSDEFRAKVFEISAGVAQQKVNLRSFKEVILNLPSVSEQTEIVRRVEQLFAYADQIEQRVKDAQARVNHLTQSILAKAFRGELTAEWRAQNPELISGENSAAALLERIRAEREAIAKPKRKVKV